MTGEVPVRTEESQRGLEPAFPSQILDASGMPRYEAEEGLTKREVFAMVAMQGILAHGTDGSRWDVAHDATNYADALLKVLAK